MKIKKIKQLLCLLLCVAMMISMLPMTAEAYVGAMEENSEEVTAGVETVDGKAIHYLKNEYIGFYIKPDGSMVTLPSQMGANDAAKMGYTEKNLFYKKYLTDPKNESWQTDYSTEYKAAVIGMKIDQSDPKNPKILLELKLPFENFKVEITYEIVKLDRGAHDINYNGNIIGRDSNDDGKTWGIEARAKIPGWNEYWNEKYKEGHEGNWCDYYVTWVTEHKNFGSVAHSIKPNIRINRHSRNDNGSTWFYSAALDINKKFMDAKDVNEVYTDSFTYANQFVAFDGYIREASWGAEKGWQMWTGIEGHLKGEETGNYGEELKYDGNLYSASEELDSRWNARALWGFRDLYSNTTGSNPPPDPVSITSTPRCVGIVKSGDGLIAESGPNQETLIDKFGKDLLTVIHGDFKQDQSGNFIFKSGALRLAPSLTASWKAMTPGIVITKDGEIKATGVKLSTPTLMFYSPLNDSNDTSLKFSFVDNNLKIEMNPYNNAAILHLNMPGAVCSIDSVTTADGDNIIFEGEMSMSTPLFDVASISMNRLGMGMKDGSFGITGVEASGAIDMSKLLGMDALSVTGEINTFPDTERYRFTMDLDVFGMFEAAGELELKPIQNGALIPNTLKLRAASEAGIPLVPPVVVAEINGLGGGFSGLADSIKGDFFGIPPIKISVTGKITVVETFEGWGEVTMGLGYYGAAIKDAKLLNMDVVDEFSWYQEIGGEIREYNGSDYYGLKVGGGMKVDLTLIKDLPLIEAGGEVNAFAFAGIDNIVDPKNIYVILNADGKIYGKLKVPDLDIELPGVQLDYALGGQTVIPVSMGGKPSFEEMMERVGDSAKDAFKNASAYGSVSYSGTFIFIPYRIYYIFKDKVPGIEIGSINTPDNFRMANSGVLLDPETKEQVGIMALGDNMTILASSDGNDMWNSLFAGANIASAITIDSGTLLTTSDDVEQNSAKDKGVTITKQTEKSYSVEIDSTAPDTNSLMFVLKPNSGIPEDFLKTIEVQKGSEPITLVAATFDADGQVNNKDKANVVIGEDSLWLVLPGMGSYSISSTNENFDIACVYASPFASFDGMNLNAESLTGSVKDRADGTEYIRRTYLGSVKGETKYLLSQSEVTSNSINETIQLSGTLTETGNYYVTTILLEKIKEDLDGNGQIDADEYGYVTTDTYAFENSVSYTNTIQPSAPQNLSLESIGSEVMRAKWKAPASGDVDGYNISLYQEEGGKYIPTGAVYQLKSSELSVGVDGLYSLDMAVTVGDEKNRLQADKKYKIGIQTFKYLVDENSDRKNDSFPMKSIEVHSDGRLLPRATYPVLSYDIPYTSDGMKIFNVSSTSKIVITSDVEANIVVTRMDTNEKIIDTNAKEVTLETPNGLLGSLNLKITAKDAEGDTTVEYIGLRLNDTPPTITLDRELFRANQNDGSFTITGLTESGTNDMSISLQSEVKDTDFFIDKQVFDHNGAFTIDGRLNEKALSLTGGVGLKLEVTNAAGLTSGIVTQVVRANDSENVPTGNTPNNGAGSSSPTNTYTPVITTDKQPNMPAIAKMSVSGTVQGGVLLATITDQMINESIKAAQEAANKFGNSEDGIAVEFNITGSGSYTSMSTTIDDKTIDRLKEAGVKFIKIGSSVLDITLDAGAISEIDKQSTGAVTVSSKAQSKLSQEAKKLIGTRPVLDISVSYQKNGNTERVENFGNGLVTLGIPYIPSKGENVGNLFGVYVDRNGRPQFLSNSTYSNGRLTFQRNSLSTYGVGYKDTAPTFADTVKHWAKDNIDFVTSRVLITGTSSTTFDPNVAITRADFLMALGRLSGADVSSYKTSSFIDVMTSSPAMRYIEWAVQNKIVQGIGNSKFGPEMKITRQDIAIMMQNYTKATGYKLPVFNTAVTFSDNEKIASYAKAAVTVIQRAGIMQGTSSNTFNPEGSATRAEAATILRRFAELIIGKGTARGWSQNDAGMWHYVGENGKAVTGWLTEGKTKYYFNIDGSMVSSKWLEIDGKWYYFYNDGSLAKSVKVDGYEVDENGVRKTN